MFQIIRKMVFLGCFISFSVSVLISEASGIELFGAGATFPHPLYNKMFEVYARQSGVKITYEGIGSGGGIEQMIKKAVDFGGTDAFMTEKELKEAGDPIIHIPTCLGAVALTYNLPGNPKLKFTPAVISDIFLGKIKKWNDPKIAEFNSSVKLPAMAITVIHRGDASGTTFIFSEYLSKVSREWKEKVGAGKSLSWPLGLDAKGNPMLAGMVKQTPGSIGYVELIYALGNDMTVGIIRNKAGRFIEPTPESVSFAANVALPDDTNISLTDTPAPQGYAISSFTWLILYKEQNYAGRSREKAEELTKLLWWMIHEGKKHTALLLYSPLPEGAVKKAENLLKTLTYNDVRLLPSKE
jgi:phosphate transport system substrate-binding protein